MRAIKYFYIGPLKLSGVCFIGIPHTAYCLGFDGPRIINGPLSNMLVCFSGDFFFGGLFVRSENLFIRIIMGLIGEWG